MAHSHSIRRFSVPMKEIRFSSPIHSFPMFLAHQKQLLQPWPWPHLATPFPLQRGDQGLFQGFSMTSGFGTQGAKLQGDHCSGQAPWAEGWNPWTQGFFDFSGTVEVFSYHWNFWHADFTLTSAPFTSTFHDSIFNSACNRTRFNLFGANSISPSQAIGGCPHLLCSMSRVPTMPRFLWPSPYPSYPSLGFLVIGMWTRNSKIVPLLQVNNRKSAIVHFELDSGRVFFPPWIDVVFGWRFFLQYFHYLDDHGWSHFESDSVESWMVSYPNDSSPRVLKGFRPSIAASASCWNSELDEIGPNIYIYII